MGQVINLICLIRCVPGGLQLKDIGRNTWDNVCNVFGTIVGINEHQEYFKIPEEFIPHRAMQ